MVPPKVTTPVPAPLLSTMLKPPPPLIALLIPTAYLLESMVETAVVVTEVSASWLVFFVEEFNQSVWAASAFRVPPPKTKFAASLVSAVPLPSRTKLRSVARVPPFRLIVPVAESRPKATKERLSVAVVLPRLIVAVPEEIVSTPMAVPTLLPRAKPVFPPIVSEPPLTVSVLVPAAFWPMILFGMVAFVVPKMLNEPPDCTVTVTVPATFKYPVLLELFPFPTVVEPVISTPPTAAFTFKLSPAVEKLLVPARVILLVGVKFTPFAPVMFPFRTMLPPDAVRLAVFDVVERLLARVTFVEFASVPPLNATEPVPSALLLPAESVPELIVVAPE